MIGADGTGRPKVLPDTTLKPAKFLDTDIAWVKQLTEIRGTTFSAVARDLLHVAVTSGPALGHAVQVVRRIFAELEAREVDLSPALEAEAEDVVLALLDLYAARTLGFVHDPPGLEPGSLAHAYYEEQRPERTAERREKAEVILAAELHEHGLGPRPLTEAEEIAEVARMVLEAEVGDETGLLVDVDPQVVDSVFPWRADDGT